MAVISTVYVPHQPQGGLHWLPGSAVGLPGEPPPQPGSLRNQTLCRLPPDLIFPAFCFLSYLSRLIWQAQTIPVLLNFYLIHPNGSFCPYFALVVGQSPAASRTLRSPRGRSHSVIISMNINLTHTYPSLNWFVPLPIITDDTNFDDSCTTGAGRC